MKLPPALLESLRGTKGYNEKAFVKVHENPAPLTSIRLNTQKSPGIRFPSTKIPWTVSGCYLQERPSFTFDPLFHAGCYYVQEASSMFLEQAFRQLVDLNSKLKVLDMSAAPGGKSTHIQSLINKESLLVSNEVIKSRSLVLKDNIVKWGAKNVVVTQNDPRDFSRLGDYFDVVVVDAPCSGSGLFRRDESAMDEWSLNNIALCSQRQQRILVDAWHCLKQDGILIYSTCSYSREENENILEWIFNEFPCQGLKLKLDAAWDITEVKLPNGLSAYRFWPDKVKGEGFFLACVRKTGREDYNAGVTKTKQEGLSKKEITELENWIRTDGLYFFKSKENVYAWPIDHVTEFNFLLKKLHVIYSGVLVGEFVRNKFIPSHELSMTDLISDDIPFTELSEEQAIKYLRRDEIKISGDLKGWTLVKYEGFNLGWVNVLANRVNNYYPKALRILKEPKNSDISK